MSQCHEEYPQTAAYRPSAYTRRPQGTQCHDAMDISVMIAGSDDSTRSRIHRALAADERVGAVTEVAACDDALRRCDEVDVVVVGLRSKSGLGPLGAISQIARRSTRPSIVAISPAGERWLDLAARAEGADEVVDWPDGERQLVRAVIDAAHPIYL